MESLFTIGLKKEIDLYLNNLEECLAIMSPDLEEKFEQKREDLIDKLKELIVPVRQHEANLQKLISELSLLNDKKCKNINQKNEIAEEIQKLEKKIKKCDKQIDGFEEEIVKARKNMGFFASRKQKEEAKKTIEWAEKGKFLNLDACFRANERIDGLKIELEKFKNYNDSDILKKEQEINELKNPYADSVGTYLDKSNELYKEFLFFVKEELVNFDILEDLFSKIEIWDKSGLNHRSANYKNLFQVLALSGTAISTSSNMQWCSLDNSFSKPCQELFETVCYKMQLLHKNDCLKETPKIKFPKEETNIDFAKLHIVENAIITNDIGSIEIASSEEPLYNDVIDTLTIGGNISVAFLQRNFKIGYQHASKIIDLLEKNGLVSEDNGKMPRKVLKAPIRIDLSNSFINAIEDFELKLKTNSELMQKIENLDFNYYVIDKSILEEIRKICKDNPSADLPTIVSIFRESTLKNNELINDKFREFSRLFRETPEQILITEQRYYQQKQIDAINENAEKVRMEAARQNDMMHKEQIESAKKRCLNCVYGLRCPHHYSDNSVGCTAFRPRTQ